MSKREAILSSLFAALQSVDGLNLCERNRTIDPDESQRPALLFYDGSEAGGEPAGQKRGAPQIIVAQPSVWGFVAAADEQLGTRLNSLLAATQKAVLTDAGVIAALGANGTISVSSMETLFARGKKGEGAFHLKLNAQYVLLPSEL